MCEYCHQEYCCLHGRHHHYYYPRHFYERPMIYEEPRPERTREHLEDEKKMLERRLKEIESRLQEESKAATTI
ncbi:MAG: hypothetical protein M1368_04315 [Thaumarchaeota archaeon]|nr:hypothetical protein [Nitrososphaerota archaeon]